MHEVPFTFFHASFGLCRVQLLATSHLVRNRHTLNSHGVGAAISCHVVFDISRIYFVLLSTGCFHSNVVSPLRYTTFSAVVRAHPPRYSATLEITPPPLFHGLDGWLERLHDEAQFASEIRRRWSRGALSGAVATLQQMPNYKLVLHKIPSLQVIKPNKFKLYRTCEMRYEIGVS